MHKRLVLALVPATLLAVAVAPSSAAPKETKGTFAAAGTPDPSADAFDTCQGLSPAARFEVPFKVPAAGKLKVEITGYQGDWDLSVEGPSGAPLGTSAGFVDAATETVQLKFKKATEVVLVACNFVGGPTAAGSFVFTPTK